MKDMKQIIKTLIISLLLFSILLSPCVLYASSHTILPQNKLLAVDSPFQSKMMSAHRQLYRSSLLLDAKLLYSLIAIGEYLFGNPDSGTPGLPLEFMESVMRCELGNALTGINLSTTRGVENGIVTLQYSRNNKTYAIQIALSRSLSPDQISNYEWIVFNRYAIRVLPGGISEKKITPPIRPIHNRSNLGKPRRKGNAHNLRVAKIQQKINIPRRSPRNGTNPRSNLRNQKRPRRIQSASQQENPRGDLRRHKGKSPRSKTRTSDATRWFG